MTAAPYITDPADAYAADWSLVAPSLWLTTEPLRDRRTGLYARLTYQGALDACGLLGGTLATVADVTDLHHEAALGRAVELPPVTLPTVAMVRAAGYQGDLDDPAFQVAAQVLRVASMGGLDWARLHDEGVRAHLSALVWTGEERVAGAGKHWVAGAPPGRAWLMGWWDGRRWIQPPPAPGSRGPHDRGHHDYATTTLCRRVVEPADLHPPEPPPPPSMPSTDPAASSPPLSIPSPHRYSGWPTPPRLVVLHTTETACAPGVAEQVGRWFASSASQASSHYIVGPELVVQCVEEGDRAWHVGAPANGFAFGVEQTGRAAFTAADWAGPEAVAMLGRVVEVVAGLCQRWAIPARCVGVEGLRAGESGITTHAAVAKAWSGSGHWDPGPAYPLEEVVRRVACHLGPGGPG